MNSNEIHPNNPPNSAFRFAPWLWGALVVGFVYYPLIMSAMMYSGIIGLVIIGLSPLLYVGVFLLVALNKGEAESKRQAMTHVALTIGAALGMVFLIFVGLIALFIVFIILGLGDWLNLGAHLA